MKKDEITLLGAGLIGSLMGIYLRKQGLDVQIYDKRPDPRELDRQEGGRSINMALSHRGWQSLDELGLRDQVMPLTIPMYGRSIHDEHGKTSFMPYGKEGQAIYSISRGKFNQLLLEEALRLGAKVNFSQKCEQVRFRDQTITFSSPTGTWEKQASVIIGADGAYSALRMSMQRQTRLNYRQEYISHGYKELSIPATKQGEFALDPHALHIWPRGKFMLIALPNPDHSFTCTLFLPFERTKVCFDTIRDEADLTQVFQTYFDDVYPLMPQLQEEFFTNPTSGLVTVECYPWVKDHSVLLGDASHAMVPFYGQGMNCGFEDCRILNELIDRYGKNSWDLVFGKYQKARKPHTDAITQLAMENFIEMRDSVARPGFLIRKKIDQKLHELFPKEWIPLYSMVTFSDMGYADAYAQGKLQESVLDAVMEEPQAREDWESLDFNEILHKMEATKSY